MVIVSILTIMVIALALQLYTAKKQVETFKMQMKPSYSELRSLYNELEFMTLINKDISINDGKEIYNAINNHYHRSGLSKIELYSLCGWESRLVKNASSPTADFGICQINRNLYQSLVKQNIITDEWSKINDIDYNVYVATKLLEYNKPFIQKMFPHESDEHKRMASMVAYNSMRRAGDKDFRYFNNVEKIKNKIDEIPDVDNFK